MRKVLVVSLVAGALGLGLMVPRGSSAPALADKPVKYEFAELRSFRGGAQAAVRAGGGIAAPAALPPVTVARWTTAQEELDVKDWEELADKLKAPAQKKDSPPTVHKLRVLNKLSEDGWEMLDHQVPEAINTVWTFRRRLP